MVKLNSLRQALLYLTNKSSTKCGNWCDGKCNTSMINVVLKSINNVNLEI